MLPMYAHQQACCDFWLAHPKMLNFSDAGSGKTRATLEAIKRRNTGHRTLVLAPLSILQPAWGDDIEKWTPELTYSVAYCNNRAKAFAEDTQVVITNHDAVKWLVKNEKILDGFDTLVIDESTAYKNRTAGRSKAINKLRKHFNYITLLSGTPNPRTVLDFWHQAYICDGGERLGRNFWSFRSSVTYPVQTGPDPRHVEWVDKEDAEEIVASMLADITFRVRLEDCISMPDHSVHTMYIDLPNKLQKMYESMQAASLAEINSDTVVTAVHAAAKLRKLLQICTGSVYDAEGKSQFIDNDRYRLVTDLILERKQCVIAFNYRHERDNLIKLAEKEGISYGVIDGDTPHGERTRIVERFQAGELKAIYAHPQSAGHGLTLTKGTTTIWCSPTDNAEHYEQFNRRIYRAGQTQHTETIRIAARDTVEEVVYNRLENKRGKLLTALSLFNELTKAA